MSNNVKIDEKYLQQFKPCKQGIANFNHHYPNWSGSLVDLLGLENMPYADKMWLARRVIKDRLMWEIFAIDCAFAAQEYATKAVTTTATAATAAYYATYAADAAADAIAATAAYYAAAAADVAAYYAAAAAIAAYYAANAAAKSAREIEQERQLSALVYLIENESEINNEEGEE